MVSIEISLKVNEQLMVCKHEKHAVTSAERHIFGTGNGQNMERGPLPALHERIVALYPRLACRYWTHYLHVLSG